MFQSISMVLLPRLRYTFLLIALLYMNQVHVREIVILYISFLISAHGKPVLVFPWVVMQELDYLKSGKTASASMVRLTNNMSWKTI